MHIDLVLGNYAHEKTAIGNAAWHLKQSGTAIELLLDHGVHVDVRLKD